MGIPNKKYRYAFSFNKRLGHPTTVHLLADNIVEALDQVREAFKNVAITFTFIYREDNEDYQAPTAKPAQPAKPVTKPAQPTKPVQPTGTKTPTAKSAGK